MARRITTQTAGISRETRERLLRLLEAVPDRARERDPALLGLLNAWKAADIPYPESAIPAARGKGGHWLMGSVPDVLASIRRRLSAKKGSTSND